MVVPNHVDDGLTSVAMCHEDSVLIFISHFMQVNALVREHTGIVLSPHYNYRMCTLHTLETYQRLAADQHVEL